MNGGWRVTDKGRSVLEIMEARSAPAQATELTPVRAVEEPTLAATSVTDAFDNASSAQARPKPAPAGHCTAKTNERVLRKVGVESCKQPLTRRR